MKRTLWRNAGFMRLWLAQILSNTGSTITDVALPLTAVLTMGATPAQMGLLGMMGSAPNLLFGLFAGVWVDRVQRGPVLVIADVGRGLLFGSIPAAAWFGWLTFTQLLAITFATSTLTIFFTLSSVSILPALVDKEQLVEANSKLATSDSLLSIAGPGIAGLLVQWITAPMAIIIDAFSYFLSATVLRRVVTLETAPVRPRTPGTIWQEIGEGIRELMRTPALRTLTLSAAAGSLGGAVQNTVSVLFLTHTLTLTPTTIGLVFACGGVGSLVGAFVAARATHWLGLERGVALGSLLWAFGAFCLPLAGLLDTGLLLAGTGQAIAAIGATIWSINQMSLRQQITPVNLFARATAARRFLLFGLSTVGAALGGFGGETIGLRATLLVGAAGYVVSYLVLLVSPELRK
jgi:MFS family permease